MLSLGVCYVLSVRSSEPATKPTPVFGRLQLDVSPLGTPVWADGAVIVGNGAGELRRFNGFKGPPESYKLSKYRISAPVLAVGNVVYVGDENGMFWAFAPGSGIKWSYRTGNQITGGAILADSKVWVGSHDQTLYAFDPESGQLLHEVECDGQINGAPLFHAGMLYLGNCDGNLRKIDVTTGKVVAALDFEAPIPETPAWYEGVLYILTHRGELAAVDADSFHVRYRIKLEETYLASPYPTGEYLFLTDSTGKLHVHSRRDGARLSTLESDKKMTALQAGDDAQVFAVSKRAELYSWKREDNQWRSTLLADFQADCTQSAVLLANVLLVADDNGGLFYYRLEDGDEPDAEKP